MQNVKTKIKICKRQRGLARTFRDKIEWRVCVCLCGGVCRCTFLFHGWKKGMALMKRATENSQSKQVSINNGLTAP